MRFSQEDKAILKNIGLDVDGGIDRFGGEEDIYLDVLRSYASNTPSLLATAESVSEAGLADYAITVHGVKGSSFGICADKVAGMAEALEKAAKTGDFGYVDKHNAVFIETARKLLARIGEMLARDGSGSAKIRKDRPDADALDRLREACVLHEIYNVDQIVAELDAFEYDSGGELVAWLLDSADRMNYEEIIERLSTL